MDTRRVEAFSDGVFAVAITVLVFNLLEITLGKHPYRSLADAWPSYFAYVVSFLTIGIMWMNHHTIFGHITRACTGRGPGAQPVPAVWCGGHPGWRNPRWWPSSLKHWAGAPALVSGGLVRITLSGSGLHRAADYVVTYVAKLGGRAASRRRGVG